MRFLSVCSGIEAASVAWNPLGWEASAFAEIEPFPCAVLAHHYPEVPNRGDMTKFEEWPIEPIDLLCGGTPCQSFSVAGLRKGLDDPRGNLMLTFGAIAARHRPRWLVWENVPGVLSSNGGGDFGTFLGMLGQLGYGFAYRVLDAQYFGVPQRRRRVFVVGCLGDWRAAAAVLFERESLSGNPAPRREAGERPAAGTLRRTDGGSDVDHARAGHLIASLDFANMGDGGNVGWHYATKPSITLDTNGNIGIAHALRADGFDASEDGTGRGTPLIADTLTSNGDAHSGFRDADGLALAGAAVRRLTPRECERLQGFPDDYTLITYRGKPAADGPRYKALGNSMAVPVMRWIGDRVRLADETITQRRAA
jgi:DNA (cytosine-5)-methyltransferase 1